MANYALPPLPYDYNALEPWIDEATMRLHHDKHHQVYLDNFVKAVTGTPFDGKPVGEILGVLGEVPEAIRGVVRNHGGGFANHSLFWEVMGPGGGGAPAGDLARAIDAAFGSFAAFQEKLAGAAVGQFGSGWGWLVVADGKLEVLARPNQDSPLAEGKTPILGVDVWEHAYYLNYQNRRADYVKAWWNTVRWDKVAARWASARG